MPDLRAVIFDLDDTLFMERDYAFSAFAAVAKVFEEVLGDPDESAAEMRRLYDTEHRRRVFNTIVERRGLAGAEQLVPRMIETYRTHKPAIQLAPDAAASLTRLRADYKLGLITDGPAVMQRAKVEALRLRPRLDAIILTDELGPDRGKPDPYAFAHIAGMLGADASECFYVADNAAKDFVAPNALGWTTVQIKRPGGVYADRAPATGGEPQHSITSLDQLDRLLH